MKFSKPIVSIKQDKDSMIKSIANDLVEHPGSYVFVIGAGGSASVNVPTSSKLKGILINSFGDEMLSRLNEKLKQKGEALCDNLDKVALEVLLPIYAEIVKKNDAIERFLKGHLWEFLSEKRFPPLGYEILAHLMNHRLIKHLVSMNFDELLEFALDEEIGRTNYEEVRNKSKFAWLLDEQESGEEYKKISSRRILLKPHGTISLAATLRPEFDKVLDFEEEKYKVLEKIFAGNKVIFVGYSFLDPDFQKVILPLANEGRLKRIYFIDNDEELPNKNDKINALLSQTTGGATGGFICEESDEFLVKLVKAIRKTENGEYYPKIIRHKIRSLIFQQMNFDPTPQNKLLVEILVFSLKVKGKFKTKALLSCERIKYYTRELVTKRERDERDFPTVYDILRKLEGEILLIKRGENNEKVYDIGDEVCYLIGSIVEKEKQQEELAIKEQVINNIVTKLPGLLGKPDIKLDGYLRKLMEDLVEEFDYDLSIELHPFEFSFQSPSHKKDPIEHRKTLIALEILKQAVTEQPPCYVIAETGEWLTKLLENTSTAATVEKILKSDNVRIILSSYQKDPLNALHRARAVRVHKNLLKKCGPNKNIKFLDWDLNKHHGTFSMRRCIYFYKDGKPSTLQPLEIKVPADNERLMNLCAYLWNISKFLNDYQNIKKD